MLWFCHLCGVLAGGLLQRTGGNSGWAEGCQIDVLSGSLNQSKPQHTEYVYSGKYLISWYSLMYCTCAFTDVMCSILICPLFSEFSCDFYQAHFYNILICTSQWNPYAQNSHVRGSARTFARRCAKRESSSSLIVYLRREWDCSLLFLLLCNIVCFYVICWTLLMI